MWSPFETVEFISTISFELFCVVITLKQFREHSNRIKDFYGERFKKMKEEVKEELRQEVRQDVVEAARMEKARTGRNPFDL